MIVLKIDITQFVLKKAYIRIQCPQIPQKMRKCKVSSEIYEGWNALLSYNILCLLVNTFKIFYFFIYVLLNVWLCRKRNCLTLITFGIISKISQTIYEINIFSISILKKYNNIKCRQEYEKVMRIKKLTWFVQTLVRRPNVFMASLLPNVIFALIGKFLEFFKNIFCFSTDQTQYWIR